MRTLPTWRSLLYVPATRDDFVAKAHRRGADAIILDLEDAVAPAEKPAARAALARAVPAVRQPGPDGRGAEVCVRINRPLRMAAEDIAAAVGAGADVLVLTKLLGPDHVRLLAELTAESEAAQGVPVGSTRFIGLVETAAALPQMEAIARADDRMVALGAGGEDLATDLGMEPVPDALYIPKMLAVVAARAAGILPLGFVGTVAGLSDMEGYRAMLRRSRALGFACASCVHPSQVPVINEEYGARPEEVERARRMVAAFEASLARGVGAVTFEGQMIDAPIVERARRLLRRLG
ncbi:HpcH/HpaI aldolase/citrate lyase family protein [Paracraurococcus ruber]|uniref:CoA ester lyase n=1 Tax=Paracraurococcus ruber TaxID=77675 RepID=A0ABS1CX98_9PROT|nr:CoA ester lyase [Paracraurococcus ruber]MBK1659034.1 CoA ester lyase [Paracraurococcus ruber]TDG31294.1 CoA ester lyase [Paracraurococcus ruber]